MLYTWPCKVWKSGLTRLLQELDGLVSDFVLIHFICCQVCNCHWLFQVLDSLSSRSWSKCKWGTEGPGVVFLLCVCVRGAWKFVFQKILDISSCGKAILVCKRLFQIVVYLDRNIQGSPRKMHPSSSFWNLKPCGCLGSTPGHISFFFTPLVPVGLLTATLWPCDQSHLANDHFTPDTSAPRIGVECYDPMKGQDN